jgi:hypothetical protein
VNHCWSCKNHYVDSRDATTPKCKACGWHKCSHCGACKQSGCSTQALPFLQRRPLNCDAVQKAPRSSSRRQQ